MRKEEKESPRERGWSSRKLLHLTAKPVSDTEKRRDLSSARCVLELAHHYARRREIYRATDLYLKLIREQPGTQEAQEAREAILRIAQRYEAEGKTYSARSLYDKLAALPREAPVDTTEKMAMHEKEAIRAVVKSYIEELLGVAMEERARNTHVDRGAMDEVPFVDLRDEVNVKSNFERLGRVERSHMDIPRTVNALKQLKAIWPKSS